jgi:hypothetical protein
MTVRKISFAKAILKVGRGLDDSRSPSSSFRTMPTQDIEGVGPSCSNLRPYWLS